MADQIAIRRIKKDAIRVMEMSDLGLFWLPDEDNIMHGHAVILGCEGSPYYGGAFCFDVTFPPNYPFAPPVFNYLTNDGHTRFNPNLYKNGKVCLSLLNTWAGEPWSGVQSLASVLQSIQSAVLNEDPLRNEPAYSSISMHVDIPIYNRIVQHATLETAIIGYLKNPPPYLVPFYDAFRANVLSAKTKILERVKALESYDNTTDHIDFYHMTLKYKFKKLATALEEIN
jgi:ubiquitin-protein ligase